MELTNGCICCTLRDNPSGSVGALAREGRFDTILIEYGIRSVTYRADRPFHPARLTAILTRSPCGSRPARTSP